MLDWAPQLLPNSAQELLKNYPQLAWVIGLGALAYWCYKVFAWVEYRLSTNAKQEITVWLKSTGNFATNQILAFNLSHFHSQLFGYKQFSVKCIIRTILFSFISYVMILLPIIVVFVTFLFKNQQAKILLAMPW
ncbi:MAG: hypothetical protein ACRECZ_08895, partial [Methylocella sp.]